VHYVRISSSEKYDIKAGFMVPDCNIVQSSRLSSTTSGKLLKQGIAYYVSDTDKPGSGLISFIIS
jgi:hypothetical protein